MRRFLWCLLWVTMLLSVSMLAQAVPLSICTVQPREGFGSGASGSAGAGDGWGGGAPARRLAAELSKHPLADGTPVVGVPIVLRTRAESKAEAVRRKCAFTVELWWHESVDDVDNSSIPYAPSTSRGNAIHDRSVIEYALTRGAERKAVLRASAPPVTRHGHLVVF